MKKAKKTSEFQDRKKNANRQLIHRKYVSLIYNAFQNKTTEDISNDKPFFSNYQIDMKIDDPDSKNSSWDLVLFKEEASLATVDLIFIEVKTSVKGLNLEDEIRKKIGKTISTLAIKPDKKLRIKIGDCEKTISCIEFVIASPPDCQGDLRNKFHATNKLCPIILWQIDDSSAVQSDQFVGKLSIQYISEQGIGVYPLCPSRKAKSGVIDDCYLLCDSGEWYSREVNRKENCRNLRKHNLEEMNVFLRKPNITSGALIPGRSSMIDNVVNEVVLITNGPLSGKGEKISKTRDEWMKVIDEFFKEYGLNMYDEKTTYGDFYSKQLIGAGILMKSNLNPNSYFVKNISGKLDKILNITLKKVFEYEEKNKIMSFKSEY